MTAMSPAWRRFARSFVRRPTRAVPVIFLSALNGVIDKVQAFAAGGADYIGKPFQLEEVIALVFGQQGLIAGATLSGIKYTRIIP